MTYPLITTASGNAAGLMERRLFRPAIRRAGLKGEFLMGRDVPSSVHNSAYEDAPDGFFRGDPTIADHHIDEIGNLIWFNTQVLDNVDLTFAILMNPGASVANDNYVVTGTTGAGFLRFSPQAGKARLENYTAGGGSGTRIDLELASSPHTATDGWRVFVCRLSGTVTGTITGAVDEFLPGGAHYVTTTVTNYGGTDRIIAQRPLCIGGAQGFNLAGAFDFSAFLCWYAKLSDVEVAAEAANLLTLADDPNVWNLF